MSTAIAAAIRGLGGELVRGELAGQVAGGGDRGHRDDGAFGSPVLPANQASARARGWNRGTAKPGRVP